MEEELLKRIAEQDKKLDAIYASCEKTRKYLLWAFMLSLLAIALPLIGLAFAIPWFLNTMSAIYGSIQ